MKKLISLSSAALMMGGALLAAPAAEAGPYRGNGYGPGYGRGAYAYRGYRRGNVAGPAIAAGIAGLAAGALAAQSYRPAPAYGYYGRPAYGYGYRGY